MFGYSSKLEKSALDFQQAKTENKQICSKYQVIIETTEKNKAERRRDCDGMGEQVSPRRWHLSKKLNG